MNLHHHNKNYQKRSSRLIVISTHRWSPRQIDRLLFRPTDMPTPCCYPDVITTFIKKKDERSFSCWSPRQHVEWNFLCNLDHNTTYKIEDERYLKPRHHPFVFSTNNINKKYCSCNHDKLYFPLTFLLVLLPSGVAINLDVIISLKNIY